MAQLNWYRVIVYIPSLAVQGDGDGGMRSFNVLARHRPELERCLDEVYEASGYTGWKLIDFKLMGTAEDYWFTFGLHGEKDKSVAY